MVHKVLRIFCKIKKIFACSLKWKCSTDSEIPHFTPEAPKRRLDDNKPVSFPDDNKPVSFPEIIPISIPTPVTDFVEDVVLPHLGIEVNVSETVSDPSEPISDLTESEEEVLV